MEKMLSKAELSKSKLEQLCRELQKALKEEKEQSGVCTTTIKHLLAFPLIEYSLQHRLKLMQRTYQESVDSFKKSLADIHQSYNAKEEHNKKVAEVEKLSENLNQLALDYDKKLTDLKNLVGACGYFKCSSTNFKIRKMLPVLGARGRHSQGGQGQGEGDHPAA